jgi:hypothetical protein
MRLLALDRSQAQKLMTDMANDIKTIKRNSIRLGWHMRGSCTLEDIMNMSQSEIDIVNEVINDNMELTKKTQLPFI